MFAQKFRRSSIAMSAAVLLALTACGGDSGDQPADGSPLKIKIGVAAPTAEQSLPAVARDLGIFTKHNIDAEIEMIPGGPQITAGLVGGSLQFGVYSAPAPEVGAVQGAPIKYIGTWSHRANLGLVVAPGINSVQDLAGKAVAVSSPGTTTAIYTDMLLREAGLDPATGVVRRNVGGQSAALNAFVSGQVSAAIFGAPVTYTALANLPGAKLLIDYAEQDFSWPYAGVVVTNDYADRNETTVRAVIAALKEAAAAYQDPANEGRIIDIIATFTGTSDKELVKRSFDVAVAQMDPALTPSLADHKNVIEQLAHTTPQASGFDPAKVFDVTFTE
ncbi:ABC transporter substrate-binding protein [Micromonospora craniellae]|uniref:SsuA/THI5-like domain-containing protein n=1 Tax=Micromonospora craniellae TaxID=2294034 RepID=A0A372FYZ4_9ACTN|nr:ABC transporter substrate-binding protein [Micromonospora craniellae]QOC93399.1 ABC transporter substrate-binding protein [Micromonospora craniellae]RFS45844.1 hypothetical protein D0Q02_14655 [Micromonospora craniellae]